MLHAAACGRQVLQDRLEAVELMLMQRPIVSGRFTGHAYRHFVQPLDGAFREVCSRSSPVLEGSLCPDSNHVFLLSSV